jgi:O-antigen/teichoic acid export membrane protein
MASPEIATVLAQEEPIAAPAPPTRFSNKRAYAQTFAATAVITGMGIASGILAARLLGPTGRGELAVIVFLPMLLSTVGVLEIPRSVAFEVGRSSELEPVVLVTSFWLAIGLGLLQGALFLALLPVYLSPDKLQLFSASRWFLLYLPAVFVTTTLMGSDQGRGRFGRFSILLALPGTLYVGAILLAWTIGRMTPAAFAFGVLASMFITGIFRAAMSLETLSTTKPSWGIAKRLFNRGFTYYLPAVAGLLLLRCDMFLAVRFLSVATIGLYAVAQAIAMGQLATVSPFVHVSFAAVAAEHERSAVRRTILHHFRLAQLVIVTLGAITATAAPLVIRCFFGSRFLGATSATLLLIAATATSGMAQVLDQCMRAASFARPGIVSNTVGIVAVFLFGIPACWRYGINGIAASVLTAQITNLAILIGFCSRTFDIRLRTFWAFDSRTFRLLLSFLQTFKKRIRWAG